MEEQKKRVRKPDTRVRMSRENYDDLMQNLARVSHERDQIKDEMEKLLKKYARFRDERHEWIRTDNSRVTIIRQLEERVKELESELSVLRSKEDRRLFGWKLFKR